MSWLLFPSVKALIDPGCASAWAHPVFCGLFSLEH